ncbi:MAG: TrbC/VirB2 family protein [Tatlockia sp.]|nr:TrbC/VirB2 family protein [Tatlockia sp.]
MSPIYKSQPVLFAIGIILVLLMFTQTSFAATTAGGGLPFDDWLTKISDSITGPFAFAVSIIGIVAAGATLIFGGDMNGALKALIFIVLVLAFIIAAKNTLTAITGVGALIGSPSVHTIIGASS